MNIFYQEHKILLETFIKHKVDFILVGGYAVNYYGYNRVTGDMDIWLAPNNDNKVLLLNSLSILGFDEDGIKTIKDWDFSKVQKFHIGNENSPEIIEFMTFISGVSYQEAKEMKIEAMLDGLQLPIIHINNLLQNKKSTGRTKDLADVEYLERIILLKNKK